MDEKEHLLKISKLEREANVILQLNEPLLHKLIKGVGDSIKNSQETVSWLVEQLGISGNEQYFKDYKNSLASLNDALGKYHKSVYDLMEKRRKFCYAEITKLKEELLKQEVSEQQK